MLTMQVDHSTTHLGALLPRLSEEWRLQLRYYKKEGRDCPLYPVTFTMKTLNLHVLVNKGGDPPISTCYVTLLSIKTMFRSFWTGQRRKIVKIYNKTKHSEKELGQTTFSLLKTKPLFTKFTKKRTMSIITSNSIYLPPMTVKI